jgi:hypothetical protein
MATSLRTEQDWNRRHPTPEATEEDMLLSLWNYPVSKSDLTPEHQQALENFLGAALLSGSSGRSPTEVYLTGHASDTGDDRINEALSRERATKVARYLRSRGVPESQMRVDWAGPRDPVDRGTSGLAAARNRRVDVLKFTPSQPVRRPPVDIVEPPSRTPSFKQPKPELTAITIQQKFSFDIPPRPTPYVVVAGKFDLEAKLKAAEEGRGFGGALGVTPDGKLSARGEAELIEHVKTKLTIETDPNKPGVQVKFGNELSSLPLKPEVGLQLKTTFLYVTVTLVDLPISDVELGGLHYSGTLSGKATIELAPGPALMPYLAGASPIVVVALILGLTVQGIDEATEKQRRFAAIIAAREGVAARVTHEILDGAAEDLYKDRRFQWVRTRSGLESEYDAGVNAVEALLKSPADAQALADKWKQTYAKETQDFSSVRQRVFDAIGGQSSEGTLEDAMGQL